MQYSEDRSTGIVTAVTHTASGGMGMLDYELDPDVLSELKKNSVFFVVILITNTRNINLSNNI